MWGPAQQYLAFAESAEVRWARRAATPTVPTIDGGLHLAESVKARVLGFSAVGPRRMSHAQPHGNHLIRFRGAIGGLRRLAGHRQRGALAIRGVDMSAPKAIRRSETSAASPPDGLFFLPEGRRSDYGDADPHRPP